MSWLRVIICLLILAILKIYENKLGGNTCSYTSRNIYEFIDSIYDINVLIFSKIDNGFIPKTINEMKLIIEEYLKTQILK
jgi:hypothetical protein